MKSSGKPRISALTAVLRALAAGGSTVLVAALGLSLAPVEAAARSGEMRVTVDVPASGWKGVRLKNIPAGAVLGVEVDADGPVAVLLLSAADFARFPKPERPVFEGWTEGRLTVSVRAPASGDYYVLIDNRKSASARSVALKLTGRTEPGGAAGSNAEAP